MIDIEPKKETAVRVGETLQIMCKGSRPLRVCRVEIPGESNAMVLSHGQPSEDGIEYYGQGVQHGDCGVRIAKVKDYHDGIFKCSLTSTDSRQEETASLKIIVASELSSSVLNQRDSPAQESVQELSARNCYISKIIIFWRFLPSSLSLSLSLSHSAWQI